MVHAAIARWVLAWTPAGFSAQGAVPPAVAQETAPPIPAASRVESLPPEFVEPPADGIEVRVVDAVGAPVPDAVVTWFEQEVLGHDDFAAEPELGRLRREYARSVRCGADGSTRVGKFDWVVASSGDRYAGASRVRRGKPLLLTLQPRRSIAVQAVDRKGRPVVDLSIVLRCREEGGNGNDGWRRRTDASGRVEFGPIDLFPSIDSDALRELWIAVDAPLSAPLRQRFTLADPPPAPVEFMLPETGRLVVELLDAEGAPLVVTEPGHFAVRGCYEFEEEELAAWPGARWPAVGWRAYDVCSRYELAHVETGLTLKIDANKGEGWGNRLTLTTLGPREEGEEVALQLRASPAAPKELITGRIVDESGAAVAATVVVVLWNDDSTRQGRRPLVRGTTDPAGRLSAPLDDFVGGKRDEEFEPWIEVVVPRADGNGIAASGLIKLAPTNEIGALDFGEIVVRKSPLLAGGQVEDDAGAPVTGASIEVTVLPLEAAMLRGDFRDSLLSATTTPDGRFEIWGEAPIGRLSISADRGELERDVPLWHSGQSLSLVPGAVDHRFVLWRCGTAVVELLGEFEEFDELTYGSSVVRRDGEQVGGWHGGVGDDGVVETSLPIGRGRIEINRGGTVVAVRDGIEVKPGAVTEVEPVDLSAAAHQVALTIVDEAGQPIPAGWIVMPNAEDDARIERMREMFGPERSRMFPFSRNPNVTIFQEGRVTLRSDSPFPPFAVGAAGRAAVVVRQPAGSERIVLEPAPYVALVLEYAGDAVAEPLRFMVEIAADNDDEEWFRFGPDRMSRADQLELPRLGGIVLERDQPVELPMRCLGRTRLSLLLGEKSAYGHSGTTLECDPAEIVVERSADDQVFHLKVDRAAIDAILAERSKRE